MLWLERWYPLLAGGITAMLSLCICLVRNVSMPTTISNLFLAVVSISAIAVGFLATAKSILITIDQKRIIDQLKSTGYYNLLVDYLMSAVRWSFALSTLSAICLLFEWVEMPWWKGVLLAVWIGTVSVAAFSCYRVIHIFGKLLRYTGP